MQNVTITTRKIAATATDGEYIKATASTGETVKIPYPYALDAPEAHEKAARALPIAADDDAVLTRVSESVYGYTFHVGPYTV